MPNYLTFALMLPFCGFFALTTMISANTYVQTTTPHELRGRVMGFYLLIFMGATPIGSPFIGWLADALGVRATVAICGGITTLGGLLIYSLMRKRLFKYSYAAQYCKQKQQHQDTYSYPSSHFMAHHRVNSLTTYSIQAVSARTSSGSIAGNIAMRN